MTTINEFKQQKQAIEIEVAEMIVMPMQPFTSSEELDKSLRMYQRGIIMLLKNLQPPRPTCSTCKFIKIATIAPFPFCSKGVLDVIHSNVTTSCIYHSDYGDAK